MSLAVNSDEYMNAVAVLDKAKYGLENQFLDILKKTTPGWSNVKHSDFVVEHLGGAMTNLIFTCAKPEGPNEKVLFRVFGAGTELFFPREDEKKLFKLLSEKDLGIGVLGEFENGRIEQIINGTTCTSANFRKPEIYNQVAQKMRNLHELDLPISKEPQFLSKIYDFLGKAKKLCVGDKFNDVDFDQIEAYVKELERITESVPSKIVFAHCDLQYGNIMKTENDLVLIDFEYSAYNPRGYDIGNFFSEWAYDYHDAEVPHLCDFSKYPTVEEQKDFCRTYLEKDGSVDESEVEKLMHEGNVYALGCHLTWILWGYIQANQSTIDFDFLGYANARLEAFVSQKEKLGF